MSNSPPPNRDARQDTLLASIFVLLALTATQKIIGFARSVLVYRWLNPVETGTWAMAQAMLDTALPLVLLSVPGCFGRYIERFQKQRQAHRFLLQAAMLCLGLMTTGGALVYILRHYLARVIFGSEGEASLVIATAVALVPTATFAFGNELLVALRQSKSSSRGHFLRALLFTSLTVGLVLGWRRDVYAMIVACGLSYALALIPLTRSVFRSIRSLPPDERPLAILPTWRGLAPMIFMIWIADFMTNMFLTVDRYMLLAMLPGDRETILGLIGNYESAQVIPILVATTTFMVARLLLPYQAKDWEHGRSASVSDSVGASVQWGALTLMPASLLVAALAPLVFEHWFQGKYSEGQRIVALMSGVYVWSGLSALLMNYFWCIEKASRGIAASLCGLICNVGLNAFWVPTYGIAGAAAATLAANGVQFVLLLAIARRLGLQPRRYMVAAGLLPATFFLPVAVAWTLWAVVLLFSAIELVRGSDRSWLRAEWLGWGAKGGAR